MSVIDSLIRGMHFNTPDDGDGDDMGDDFDNSYEDEEEEQRPRRFTFGGRRNNTDLEDDPEDDYPEERPVSRPALLGGSRPTSRQTPAVAPQRRQSPMASNMQVRIIKPRTFEQTKEIADTLLDHRTVLMNLEGLDVNTAQRIVDFASGACYALNGTFMKISNFIIVITPEGVGISNDDLNATPAGAMAGAAMRDQAMGSAYGAGYGAQGGFGGNAYGNPGQYSNV